MDQDEFIDVDQVSLNIKQDIENADFQQRVLPSAVSEELIDAESQTFRSVAAVQNTQPTFPVTGTHNALSPLGLKSGCEVEETSQGVVPPALPPHFPLEHTRIIYQGSVNEVKKSVESASSSFSCTLSFDLTKHKWTLSAGNGDNDLKVVVRIFSQPDTSYLVEVQRRQGDAGSFINVYHHIKRILESEVENVENQPMSRSHKRACVFEAATDLRRLPTNLPPIDPQVGAAAVAAVQEMAKSPMVDVAFEGARILKALSSQVTAERMQEALLTSDTVIAILHLLSGSPDNYLPAIECLMNLAVSYGGEFKSVLQSCSAQPTLQERLRHLAKTEDTTLNEAASTAIECCF